MKALLTRSLLFTLLAAKLCADSLDHWHWRNPLPTGGQLYDLAYGNGIYVCVGEDILISTNGSDWELSPVEMPTLGGIQYGGGLFVAVSNDHDGEYPIYRLLTSDNGINWTERYSNTLTNASRWGILGIAYGNGTFVVPNRHGRIVTSSDGTTWGERELPIDFDSGGVIFADNKFIVAGATNTSSPYAIAILISDDGTNWVQTFSGFANSPVSGLAYGNGSFVATSSRGDVFVSQNGLSWEQKSTTLGYDVYGLAFGNGTFVTLTPTTTNLTSTNGLEWIPHGQNFGAGNLSFNNGQFFYLAFWAPRTSIDGVSWIDRSRGFFDILSGAAYQNDVFIAFGHNEALLSSSDGTNWVRRNGGGTNSLEDVTFGNGSFIAVGSRGRVLTSSNLTDWASQTVDPLENFFGVAFGNGTFVATANNYSNRGAIYTSIDGLQWVKSLEGYPELIGCVAFGNGTFVALTRKGESLTSQDGISWTSHVLPIADLFKAMLWADGKFVAVGGIAGGILEAPVMTSTDGMNWVSQSSGVTGSLEGLAWGNGRFIATAWDRIVVSTDGLRWVPQRIRRRNGGTGIAWGKNTFVVVDGYYILQSDPFFGLKMQNPAELTVSALPGQSFRIEAASELNDAGVWQPLATLTLTNSSYLWRDDSANLPDRRFYRAVLVP